MRLSDEGVNHDAVLLHPRQLAALGILAGLIGQLRACENVEDGYEFQQELLRRRVEVDEDGLEFRRAVRRIRGGKPPQPGAPEPQSGLDPSSVEAWQTEHFVCERLGRQYRDIGDALAWRVFGFQRKYILALSRNDPPGSMARKAGLAKEQETVEKAWREDGRFALMHDLTNALRIGDITVFTDSGPKIIEVKTDPKRRNATQQRRIEAAELALQGAGPLPGPDIMERLYDLDVPLQTHLAVLADGLERAAREGIFAAKLPGARALTVTDIFGCNAQGWTEEEYQDRLQRKHDGTLRRARIGPQGREDNVHATNLDLVARDPRRVPFAAYPFHPMACARLISDLAVFTVETSGPALAEVLCQAGLDAEWVRLPGLGDLRPGEVVIEIQRKTSRRLPDGKTLEFSRTLQMQRSELDRYLIELLEMATWIEGIRYLLADYRIEGKPWPHYRDEDRVWL
jgi:hypothetical protein